MDNHYTKEQIMNEISSIRLLLFVGHMDFALKQARILSEEQVRKIGKLLSELALNGMYRYLGDKDETKFLYNSLFINPAECANEDFI